MKSNHAFTVEGCYPAPGSDVDYQPVSYSLLNFIEPESYANQQRMTGIVTVDSVNGYYVDVFRSARINGDDKTHDYFYHNLGQNMTLAGADGSDLGLQPTEELAFAGAHLYAYSYIYDKKSALTDKDVKTTFTVDTPEGDAVYMNMWMKGDNDRKVFSALSPMSEGLSRVKGMPYDIAAQPTLTFVARQMGEAWTRPFVAVFEPSSSKEPGSISSVNYPSVSNEDKGARAIDVALRNGLTDRIIVFDSVDSECVSGDMAASAAYALWRRDKDGNKLAFIGNGVGLQVPGLKISADAPCDVLVRDVDGALEYTASAKCTISVGGKSYNLQPSQSFARVK